MLEGKRPAILKDFDISSWNGFREFALRVPGVLFLFVILLAAGGVPGNGECKIQFELVAAFLWLRNRWESVNCNRYCTAFSTITI